MMNLLQATWSYEKRQVDQSQPVPVKRGNRRLADELLNVSGEYLSCISARTGDELHFYYAIRQEGKGFIKLDVQPGPLSAGPIIGGYDPKQFPTEQFLSIAEKYYRAAMDPQLDMFVPASAFGVANQFGFYIESLDAWERITPFFIRASHAFIALLLSVHFSTDRPSLLKYVGKIRSGQDRLRLLEREPLMREIIDQLPEESKAPFYQQLASELTRILEQVN